MVLRARLYDAKGHDRAIDLASVKAPGREQLLWVDVIGDAETEDLERELGLGGLLDREPGPNQSAALWRTPSAVRLRILGLFEDPHAQDATPRPVPVDIVVGRNSVVSIHEEAIDGLTDAVKVYEGETSLGELDAITFTGMLFDGLLGGYFRAVERVEKHIDRVDDQALKSRDPRAVVPDLVELRRRVSIMRRALAPQREIVAAMSRPDFQLQSDLGSPWPGLADRIERAIDAVENARELLVGSFDIVMSQTAQHTDDVVRLLTVISSVLLPSVVIAGVMGMNFKLGFFDEPANFFVVLVAMGTLAIVILGFARLRHWI